MTMGQYIKYLRTQREWTQEELGKKLEPQVERAAVNKWELGLTENIKRTYILQLSILFNVKPSELMCFEEETAEELIDPQKVYELITNTFGVQTSELIKIFNKLNNEGKKVVMDNMDAISYIPKFTDEK